VVALGHPIQVGVVREAGISVDTYDDYLQFIAMYRQKELRAAA
jgi:hypothetical protein